MRFRYSFQKIVDLKNTEKTQAEWVLSGAVGRLREEEESLTSLRSEKENVQWAMCRSAEQAVPVSELMAYQHYVAHLEHRIERKCEDVLYAERVVVQKREALSSKMMEEKVWSQAREKAFRQFQAEMLKKEQEELDEIAVVRFKQMS